MIKRRKRNYVYGLAAALGVAVLTLFSGTTGNTAEAAAKATPTPDPTRKLSSITAVYTGKTEIVGHSIDTGKLTVMGLYTDGSFEAIQDYTLSQNTLTKAGANEIVISYGSVSTKIYIQAKKFVVLSAHYKKGDRTVGDVLDKEDINVYAYYSDGSSEEVKEYTLSNDRVLTVGTNTFSVFYEGQTATFSITGKPVRLVKELRAYYKGGAMLAVGSALNRNDFSVTAIYTDNTMELIDDFELIPAVLQTEGENMVIVSKGGMTTEVKVYGRARMIVSISAKYVGDPVVIGTEVNKDDIVVKAVYEGLKREEEEVKDFTIKNSYIYKLGDNNEVEILFAGRKTSVKVRGVEAEVIDYSKGVETYLADGNRMVSVNVALNSKADKESLVIQKISDQLVKKAMRKINADKYVAMEISFDDPELAVYLPMTVKVSVPIGYSKDKFFGVYYLSNRKTVVAKMNGDFLWDGTYEFKIFQPGTYVIANCKEKGKE